MAAGEKVVTYEGPTSGRKSTSGALLVPVDGKDYLFVRGKQSEPVSAKVAKAAEAVEGHKVTVEAAGQASADDEKPGS